LQIFGTNTKATFLASPKNIRLGCKGLKIIEPLACYKTVLIMALNYLGSIPNTQGAKVSTTTMAISHISAKVLCPCKCDSVGGKYVTAAAAVAVLTLAPWSSDTR
jgi:hypothetical protein